jgi:hypothetical protein
VKALVKHDVTGLVAVQRPDGSVQVDLDDRFQSVAVAVRRGGKVEEQCIATPKDAERLKDPPLQAAPRQPTHLEEK